MSIDVVHLSLGVIQAVAHYALSPVFNTLKKNPTNNESDLGLMLQLHRSNRESIDIVG